MTKTNQANLGTGEEWREERPICLLIIIIIIIDGKRLADNTGTANGKNGTFVLPEAPSTLRGAI